jgi:hypothetical protein
MVDSHNKTLAALVELLTEVLKAQDAAEEAGT